MKKYRNFVMLEQIKECIRNGRQDEALEIAEGLDIHLVRNNSDVNLMADLYIENGLYEKGFECLREIYNRKKTRSVLMQLINLSVKMKNINAAEKYYADFREISGDDFYNHIFRYNIDKIEGKPVDTLIDSLEQLKEKEYIEIWAYELAKLYHKAGKSDKCVRECNDIEVWFGEGPYVERARALKAYYKGELDLNKPYQRQEETPEKDRSYQRHEDSPGKTGSDRRQADTADSDSDNIISETESSASDDIVNEIVNSVLNETISESVDSASEETAVEGAKPDTDEAITGAAVPNENISETVNTVSVSNETVSETENTLPYEEASVTGDTVPDEAVSGNEDSGSHETIPGTGNTVPNEAVSKTVDPVPDETVPETVDTVPKEEESGPEKSDSNENVSEPANPVSNEASNEVLLASAAGTQNNNDTDVVVNKVQEEDDFAEEIKEYEEETTVESVGINIKSDFVEGDEAWINSFLEEEESELAQLIRIECENERKAEQKRAREREEKNRVKAGEAVQREEKKENKASTEEAGQREIKKENKADTEKAAEQKPADQKSAEQKPAEYKSADQKAENHETKEQDTIDRDTEEHEAIIQPSEEQVPKEKIPVETVTFDFGSKQVREIDENSLLGKFLSKREESFEDYFEFYAFQSDIRGQLIKTIEILLNPQIKNICMVVTGSGESANNTIIRGIARILFNSGFLIHKQIYKAEAQKLSPEDLNRKIDSLIGSCFVIRSASKMSKDTVGALLEINEKLTGRTAVVITDERSGITGLLKENRELNSMFPQRIHISDFSEKDLEEMAFYKLRDSGFLLAKDALPELQNRIRTYLRSRKDPVKKLADLIRNAIDTVEIRNARTFLNRDNESRFEQENVVTMKDLAEES